MAAAAPVDVRHLFQLPSLGIKPENIGFRNISVDSDKALVVRTDDGGGSLTIVDVSSGTVKDRRPMAAEAAALNPDGKSIAVRQKNALQIYSLELQRQIKSFKMPEGQAPVFWKWVSVNTLALVTPTSAYHWSIDGDAAPVKQFDRHDVLAGTQIINYATSADGKWLMTVGIKAGAAPGTVEGCTQLYSVEKKVSQPLSSHAGVFTTAKLAGRDDPAILFCFVEKKPDTPFRLMIIEVGKAGPGAFRLAPQDLPVPADAAADFPVSVQASRKHDIVYIVTKMAYVYLYDIHSGSVIFRTRITDQAVFAAVRHEATNGVIAITASTGQVIAVTINEGNMIPYILNVLRKPELAMALSSRLGLPGAEELYTSELRRLLALRDVDGAAKLAAGSPNGMLRTSETIAAFQSIAPEPGQQPPVIKYFSALMERGKLNKVESVELSRPALLQGRAELIAKWLGEDKLECSEMLGDMVAPYDARLALRVYLASGEAHEKVINCFMQTGEFDQIVPYCVKSGFTPNWVYMLQQLVAHNPPMAQRFAAQLANGPAGPLLELSAIADIFMQYNRLQECSSFLLDALARDLETDGPLQTRLIEMNLLGGAPQVVEAIFSSNMFHHFDRPHVAKLCENAGLFQRALELYTDLKDIKRVIVNTQAINPDWLAGYFGTLTEDNALACLEELLTSNMANLKIAVNVATRYYAQLGPEKLIQLFESHDSYEGLFYFLGAIVNSSDSKVVHFKYIVAAAHLKNFKEVERVCRDSTVYDPVEVKDYLLDAKLADPRPLIHVCDRYDFVDELTAYLWNNKLNKFVEVYVQKVSPAKTPKVIGKLLDLDADEPFIKSLIDAVRALCPVEQLVEEVEKRNRLRLLQPWLEQRVAEGNTETSTHNAIGKIYVTINKDPQSFLKNNQFYDPLVLGKFCEKLDPYLSFLAYRRAGGRCDAELIEVTNKNSLFKDQARYLVERQDPALWAAVLREDNPHKRQLVEQVTGTALPETKSADEVSNTVKAFMNADMPNELIHLLEKLVLHGTDFATNKNLQNLLILTAIKCSREPDAPPGRAMEYINRLDNFDGVEIARIAVRDEYQLYEEAFTIYKKVNDHANAVEVLLSNIHDIDRAAQYAERVAIPEVFARLGNAQLESGNPKAAIDSFIKAKDATSYKKVIEVCKAQDKYEDLYRFLDMARKKIKERSIDTEAVYALAKSKKISDLEMFITAPNVADIQAVGDRCFEEGLYEAARSLYSSAGNNAKLASTLVKLKQFREAVDAAKKANSLRTWKDVNAACVSAGEFRLAQMCGLYIIVSPDHLEELVQHYERHGHFEELMKLMEQGLGLENAHAGIFTELAVMYSKYKPERLKDHLHVYWQRMNVSKALRACENARMWEEATFLYIETGEFDQAVRTMMEHSPIAFTNERFTDVIQKARNNELLYKAIAFYLEEEPMQLDKLLKVLIPKLDHTRVVHQLRKADQLPLVFGYLRTVQKENITAVNEAVNEVLLDEEDYDGLRESIDAHDAFDQLALAQRIERHELLEFRRIAAYLYKRNKRWEPSMALSMRDRMYKDAIETVAASGDKALATRLLTEFISTGDNASFAATLYTCYALIEPDVALELSWRARAVDFAMPFMIQYVRDLTAKVSKLEADAAAATEAAKKASEATAAAVGMGGDAPPPQAAGYGPTLMLAAQPYDGSGGYGVPTGYPPAVAGYGMPPGVPGMAGMPGMPGVPGMPPTNAWGGGGGWGQ